MQSFHSRLILYPCAFGRLNRKPCLSPARLAVVDPGPFSVFRREGSPPFCCCSHSQPRALRRRREPVQRQLRVQFWTPLALWW